MLNQQTIEKLYAMRMRGMADAFTQQQEEPQTTQLNFRERRLAAQLLTARGLSTRDIAERLAVDPRTVSRYRRAVADLNELTNNKRSLSRPICTEAGSHRRASRRTAGSGHGPR